MRTCTSRRVAAFRTHSVDRIDSVRTRVERRRLVSARVPATIALVVLSHMHPVVAGVALAYIAEADIAG